MNIISRYDINSVVMNFVRFLIPLVRSDPSIAGIVIKHFLVFNSVHCLNHACYSFPGRTDGQGDPYIPPQTLFAGGIMIRTSYKMGYIT